MITRPTTAPSLFRNFTRNTVSAARLDVIELHNNVSVKIELPGVRKEDVQVHIEDNVLSIAAERREEKVKDTDRYHYSERSFGKVYRQVWLPAPVDEEKVETVSVMVSLNSTLPRKPRMRNVRESNCKLIKLNKVWLLIRCLLLD